MDDLISRRFGYLTVKELDHIHTTPCGTKRRMWKCQCDCGKETVVAENNLKNGSTKSCGCWKTKRINQYNTSHGGSHDRLYLVWKNMKRRCNSHNDSHYEVYGAKGVSVCEEWNEYDAFKKWAYDNGYDDEAEFGELTIDRIDNDGDYEPSNCRWVNRTVQANNTSRNRYVEFEGKRLTVAEFARAMNISQGRARYYVDKFDREVVNG